MKVAFVFNKQREKNIIEAEFDTPEVIAAIAQGLSNGGSNQVIEIEMIQLAIDLPHFFSGDAPCRSLDILETYCFSDSNKEATYFINLMLIQSFIGDNKWPLFG